MADCKDNHVHVFFPPDVDTPGYAEEMKTKPEECAHALPALFNDLFSAPQTAKCLTNGLASSCKRYQGRFSAGKKTPVNTKTYRNKDANYHIWSPDFLGNFAAMRAWGPQPKGCLTALAECCCCAPLFVPFQAWAVGRLDGVVRKYNYHGAGLANTTALPEPV